MTELEQKALSALNAVSMRLASSGKRFRRDIAWHFEQDSSYKLTERQARYLWLLVDMYRRQIKDEELLSISQHVKLMGEFPNIYLEGDHRTLASKGKPVKNMDRRIGPKTRYDLELERGGGRLAL